MNDVTVVFNMKRFVIRTLVKIKYRIVVPLEKRIVRFFPIDSSKIVFDNFGGKGYEAHPKYIAEELINSKAPYKMIWLVRDMNMDIPEPIVKVKNGTFRAYYEWATAKMWVDNIRNTDRPLKRKEQIYLQTWHQSGAILIKRIEKDAEDVLDPKYVARAKYDGTITDAIIASSPYLAEIYKKSFYLADSTKILSYGSPEADILFQNMDKQNKRRMLGFSDNDYLVLYAPTFRDNGSTDGYKIDALNVIKAFEKLTKRECKMLIRMHPNVNIEQINVNYDSKKIYDGNKAGEMLELAIICDSIITDYSTSIYGFYFQKKPIFLFCLDLAEYAKKRGFTEMFYELPFSLAKNNEELIRNISDFDYGQYKTDLDDFEKKYPDYESGIASKKTVEWISEQMK